MQSSGENMVKNHDFQSKTNFLHEPYLNFWLRIKIKIQEIGLEQTGGVWTNHGSVSTDLLIWTGHVNAQIINQMLRSFLAFLFKR